MNLYDLFYEEDFSFFSLEKEEKKSTLPEERRNSASDLNKIQEADIEDNINIQLKSFQNLSNSEHVFAHGQVENSLDVARRSTPNFDINFQQNSANSSIETSVTLKSSKVIDNTNFEKAIKDPNLKFNPQKLGFIPSTFWSNADMTFGEIVSTFFQRKNNSKCRFPHKLYNALIFSHMDENMFDLIGVKWLDDKILKVNQSIFARLLGIKAIEGSLFHQQGNFPSHGFVEIDPSIVKQIDPNFDFSKNRLLTHTDGVFVRGCTEKQIASCKWNAVR